MLASLSACAQVQPDPHSALATSVDIRTVHHLAYLHISLWENQLSLHKLHARQTEHLVLAPHDIILRAVSRGFTSHLWQKSQLPQPGSIMSLNQTQPPTHPLITSSTSALQCVVLCCCAASHALDCPHPALAATPSNSPILAATLQAQTIMRRVPSWHKALHTKQGPTPATHCCL